MPGSHEPAIFKISQADFIATLHVFCSQWQYARRSQIFHCKIQLDAQGRHGSPGIAALR
jgi:hypothetical protein